MIAISKSIFKLYLIYVQYPHWTGRRDKRGLPICVFDISALDSATMNAYKDSRAGRRDSATVDKPSVSTTIVDSIVFHDCITRFILPLCSIMDNAEGSGTEAMGCLYLVDVSALSLKQSWTLKDYTMDISKVLANNYPEMIDSILVSETSLVAAALSIRSHHPQVIGAPRYFGAIWNVLKRWLDPRTASKIQILSSKDILSTLTSFIDLDNIPEKFGGHLAFEHGMTPNIDAATRQILESHGLPNEQLNLKGPFKWITGAGGESIPLAVGTDDGRTRLKAKATT